MMSMSLTLCHQMRQLQIIGGSSEGVFPLVEDWLNASSDHQEALQFVAARKKMDRYRSMVDFLFCEIFVDFQGPCFRFYEDEGPRLIEHPAYNEAAQAKWEKRLLAGLHLAYEIFKARRVQSWTQYRLQVLALEIAA